MICLLLVTGCGLPTVGPNKSQLLTPSSGVAVPALVVEVDDRVLSLSRLDHNTGFGPEFSTVVGRTDVIQAGDQITITVFENVQNGLFGGDGAPAILGPFTVDQAGKIFVPFAGTIPAVGRTAPALRQEITTRLADQTPDPQITVRRTAGDGASVSITGTNAQGIYPITQSTARLSAMIARAGGVRTEPAVTEVTVVRGPHRGTVWLRDLHQGRAKDIALRNGDRVIIQEDRRRFSLLGAFRAQGLVDFPQPQLSALEAVAHARGLNPNTADPTGVFVLRRETAEVADKLTGQGPFPAPQRIVYVLNLTAPNGLFLAREFAIRDGDTLYVSEAPYAQFARVLNALLTTTTSAGSISEITSGSGG
jgi:polysaccharide export outer membrane protein